MTASRQLMDCAILPTPARPAVLLGMGNAHAVVVVAHRQHGSPHHPLP